jgi:hypothetical protein
MPDADTPRERRWAVVKIIGANRREARFLVEAYADTPEEALDLSRKLPGTVAFPRAVEDLYQPGARVLTCPLGRGPEFAEFDRAPG